MNDTIKREQIERKIGEIIDLIVLREQIPDNSEIESLAREACAAVPSVGALTSLLLYNIEGLSGTHLVEFKEKFMQCVIDILKPK